MDITGTPVIVVAGVLVVIGFIRLVTDGPRPRRRGVRMMTRTAEVLGLNLAVLALAGLLLNDQYLFYSSWSDLFGARSSEVVTHGGGTRNDVLGSRIAGSGLEAHVPAGPLPPLPDPGKRLQEYIVHDRYAGTGLPVLVRLPVGYNPRSSTRYPVIVGLHGFPGAPASFARLSFLSDVDALTAEHVLAPSIVVMPTISPSESLDTECVNGGPGQPQTDTWLSHDLPAWVVQHLRVQTARTSWAAVGYSLGAWCAASLTMRHPDVFGGAVVLEGYFRPDFSPAYDPLSPAALKGYDLIRLARHRPPPVAIWLLTTREDALSYPTTTHFLAAARSPLTVTATVLAHGGHRVAVFSPYIPAAFTWLAQTLPGFHA